MAKRLTVEPGSNIKSFLGGYTNAKKTHTGADQRDCSVRGSLTRASFGGGGRRTDFTVGSTGWIPGRVVGKDAHAKRKHVHESHDAWFLGYGCI